MQQPTPTPPVAPQVIVQVPGAPGATSSDVYQAMRAQRRELGNQLENLEDKRRDLSQRLQDEAVTGADRKGIEQRITEIDGRIGALDKQVADADAQVAKAASMPGAVVEPKPIERSGPPEEVYILGGMFIVIVLLPLSIAMARRIWRRGVATITKLPAELMDRLTRIEQGMDAVAVEVERIGESQRYMSRLMGDEGAVRAIGAGAAEPVEIKAREPNAQFHR
jgi:hypothetical protein